MKNKTLKYFGLGILLALIITLVIRQGWFMGLQLSLQNKFYDFDSASPEIIIVDIDEKTLSTDELGPLQKWSRGNYARAIETLNQAGASAIGIDITFPDPSNLGPDDDLLLTNTLKAHKNVVLAGHYYFENKQRIPVFPNETLMQADPKIGWLNVSLDADGFVRKIPLFTPTKDRNVEAFALQLARIYLNENSAGYVVKDNQFPFSDSTQIPAISLKDSETNEEVHFMYVNYFAEPEGFSHISMADLLKNNFTDKQGNQIDFTDKVVLIGPTALDLQDYYLSPLSEGVRMAGVEIHANAIQTLITQKFLRNQSRLSLWLMIFGLLLANLFIFSKLKVRWAVPLAAIEMIGFVVGGIIAYESLVFLNVIYPILTVLLSFIGVFLLRFIMEQNERKFIEGAFGHYVNKDLVEQIIKDPSLLELGGAKRNVTAFFSDIAGFTSISEKMDPAHLVNFLNTYLNDMTQIIIGQKGTLDKYEGDAIMAFWGAPIPEEKHAQLACAAALENQKKLMTLRAEWQKQGLPPIEVRIGINSGEAIAGNMGSENRFDYTVMGDNVNLASRLEGINKQYGTRILISGSTYEQVKDLFVCRELDRIRVKGKQEVVTIYELIAKKEEVTPEQNQVMTIFMNALNLYRQKNFIAAETEFKKLPNDPPSTVFAQRCAVFSQTPPPQGWDGVYNFETK